MLESVLRRCQQVTRPQSAQNRLTDTAEATRENPSEQPSQANEGIQKDAEHKPEYPPYKADDGSGAQHHEFSRGKVPQKKPKPRAENGVPPYLPVVEVEQKQVHADRCEQRIKDILEEYHREHAAPQDAQTGAALRTRKGDPQNAEHVIHTTQCGAEDRGVRKQHEL